MSLDEFFGLCIAEIEADQGVSVPAERLELMLHNCMGGAVREDMLTLVYELMMPGTAPAS